VIGAVFAVTAALAGAALPPHEWLADEEPSAELLSLAREAASRADFDAGYSQPFVSIEIDATATEVTTRILTVIAFGTPESIYEAGNAYAAFDRSSSRLTVHAAFVLHPDGSTHAVDHATVQSVDNDTDVFSDSVSLVLPLPALEPKSIAVVEYSRHERLDDRIYPWGRIIYLGAGYPIDRMRLSLSWDHANPLAWATDSDRLECVEALQRVTCQGEGFAALPDNEIVNYFDVTPHLSVAQRRTWQDISAVSQRVVAQAQSGTDAVRARLDAIVDGASESDDVIRRIHEFVSRSIRYVGLEQGEHGFVPHPTIETLTRRYGDCKDMTALLIELLRNAGIDARAVLVASDYERSDKLLIPSVAYFDHMVACLPRGASESLCLDPTDAYTAWNARPSHLQGRPMLGLLEDAVVAYPRAQFLWQLAVRTRNAILANGDVTERQTRIFSDAWAGSLRAELRSESPKGRLQFLVDGYRDMVGRDTVTPTFEVEHLDPSPSPLIVRSEVTFADLVDPDEDLRFTDGLGWLVSTIADFDPANRVYPYPFPGLAFDEETTFDVDAHWRPDPSGTAAIDFRSRFGTVARTIEHNGQQLTVRTSVQIPQRSVAIADLPAFRRFLDVVADNAAVSVKAQRVSGD